MKTPNYLFETSWEVCNMVGGIYTVNGVTTGMALRPACCVKSDALITKDADGKYLL